VYYTVYIAQPKQFKVEVFVTALDRLLSDIYDIQASMKKISNTFYLIHSRRTM
jgi:hypothetical protein